MFSHRSTRRLCALVALFVAQSIGAQSAPSLGPTLTPAAAQADFDVLRRALEEAHGGFDRYATRAELGKRFDAHRARLTQPLSTPAFAGVLTEMIAELRDGHARLEYDSVTSAALAAARLFPLRVALEGERLVVMYNDSPTDTTVRPGMEVVRVNQRPVAEILRALRPKVSGDGFIETGRSVRVAREFPPLYWLFVEQTSRYTIDLTDAPGRQVSATLDGVLMRDRRNTVNPVNAPVTASVARFEGPPGNVALELLDEATVARLRIRAFDGQTFLSTLDSAFRVLRDRGTKSLILDLRGNGGGVDEFGARLVSYFVNKPFRYFDHIHMTTIAPSFATWLPRTFESTKANTVPDPAGGFRVTTAGHSGVGEQKPAETPFTGKVIVLIDGGSFSTTADVTAQLRSMRRATFVGEETAGGYEGNISGLNASIVLPNSKLRLRVMMYGYWNAVAKPAMPGRGTLPDHVVMLRVSDLLRGVDPAMELARSLAK
jgi:hypothetical protein